MKVSLCSYIFFLQVSKKKKGKWTVNISIKVTLSRRVDSSTVPPYTNTSLQHISFKSTQFMSYPHTQSYFYACKLKSLLYLLQQEYIYYS